MNQAEALYHLQDVDLRLLRAQRRLTEIQTLLDDDAAVKAANENIAAAQAALTPLRTQARNLELEIQSMTQKANATEEQLYSGKVKLTKEMRDMEQEIAALKRRRGELEDSLLDLMLSIESGETTLNGAQAHLSGVLDARRDEHGHLLDEQKSLHADVAALRAEREHALKPVAPESLALYDSLRPKKKYQPVALLQGESCAGCGVEQTMAIVRTAQLGQSLATCLSCGRILYHRG